MAESGDLELEGDIDDPICETDLSELVTAISGSANKLLKSQGKVQLSGSKERSNNRAVSTGAEQSETGTLTNSGNDSQSPVTAAKKLPPRKQPDNTKKQVNKVTSDVGDIADLIGILESDNKKAGEVLPKIHTHNNENKMDTVSSVAATRKRKSSDNDDRDSAKAKKVNDIKIECQKPMGDTDEKNELKDEKTVLKEEKVVIKEEDVPKDENNILEVKNEKVVEKFLPCSEEDSRTIDIELVDEMFDRVKKRIMRHVDRNVVRFSPVEIGDLADESVQQLSTTQPHLAFYFKRQGKFKKKKGYAEVYLSQSKDIEMFIEKLLQLKLLECRIEVTITMKKPEKVKDVLSLVLWLDKNSKLVKLINTEDASKVAPDATKEHLQIEKVPESVDTQLLKTLFPFAADIAFSSEQKKVESGFEGPVNVSYVNAGWLEAVLDCCSDHTYNGHPLSIQYTKKKQEPKTKPDIEVKREAVDTERRSSVHDDNGDSGYKIDKDGASSSANHKSESIVDEDISNMTRDVCSGMMDSLNKLRQLGTDNPNVMRILEMQNELLKLQRSLSQSTEKSATVAEEDPWTVTAADSIDDNQQKLDNSEKDKDKKLSREQKKRPEKESRAEKQRREMEDFQRIIDNAEEAKMQREERAKKQLDIEKQKIKELEERRKSSWARRMIEDAKQSPTHVSGENASSKEEVQRILKLIENKRKEAEETKKAEETKGFETAESGQAVRNTGGPDEILKTAESDSLGTQPSQDGAAAKEDDGHLSHKQTASEVGGDEPQKADTQDTSTEILAWSPGRALHEGAPVYSEEEFSRVCSSQAGGVLPWDYHIRITYYADRRCPVESCPATKYFKTLDSFTSHWDVFHTAQVTVKFCQKCNAYFTNSSELESHLVNRHSITNSQTVKKMTKEAREKIVANPSFREPGRYLPPLV